MAHKYIRGAIEHVSADSADYKTFMGNYRQYKTNLQAIKKHKGDDGKNFQNHLYGDQSKLIKNTSKIISSEKIDKTWLQKEEFSILEVTDTKILDVF